MMGYSHGEGQPPCLVTEVFSNGAQFDYVLHAAVTLRKVASRETVSKRREALSGVSGTANQALHHALGTRTNFGRLASIRGAGSVAPRCERNGTISSQDNPAFMGANISHARRRRACKEIAHRNAESCEALMVVLYWFCIHSDVDGPGWRAV